MWHCDIECEPVTRATWHPDITIIRMTDDRCHHGITHQTPGDQWRTDGGCLFIGRLWDFSFNVDCKIRIVKCGCIGIVTCYWPVLIQRRKNEHKLELKISLFFRTHFIYQYLGHLKEVTLGVRYRYPSTVGLPSVSYQYIYIGIVIGESWVWPTFWGSVWQKKQGNSVTGAAAWSGVKSLY